jgi:hypothetical protein
MTDLLKCPICDKPLRPDDLCASDIEMGAFHAECLEGSPVVDLDTGEETPDAKVDTFRAREIMEPGRQQRDKFEAAVVKRLQESGFLEVEIRTECLARVGQGYQDEVINAGWYYWNEALWQNIPLVDPVLGRSPDGLDFATPDEVFDKGPEAVREWQEARGRKPETPPPSSQREGRKWHLGSMNDGLFIIDTPPRPSTDDIHAERTDGPSIVLKVHGMSVTDAQAICDAHNSALATSEGSDNG